MEISFQTVIPHPLKDYPHSANSIWGNNFTIEANSQTLINASSGKGKSTFSGILYGTRKDYSGSVFFNKEDIANFTPEKWTEIRKHKLAVVFQDLQLFPNLSVKQNLMLKNDLTQALEENKILQYLDVLGIKNKYHDACGILSMGQQQRVAIIRALCQPFEIILMDEPFSHLDKENIALCYEIIHERCKEQQASLILTSLGEKYAIPFNQELSL